MVVEIGRYACQITDFMSTTVGRVSEVDSVESGYLKSFRYGFSLRIFFLDLTTSDGTIYTDQGERSTGICMHAGLDRLT